jgi:hypothetical protein
MIDALPPRHATPNRNLALTALALVVLGCGGEAPTPKTAAPDDPSTQHHSGAVPNVSSEIGALDEDKVDATFSHTLSAFERCLKDGAGRVEFLGGTVSFYVKIDAEGKLEHAHMEQSTLGDRDTEKCMIGALRSKTWPKPVGGKSGLAHKSFDFDPPNDVRPPSELSQEFIDKTLNKRELREKISECKRGETGTFTVTMYIDTEGHALGVGVAPPDEAGEDDVDCLVDALKQAEFPSPGSWAGKVQFAL